MDVVIRHGPQWIDDLSTVAAEQWPELIGEYRAFCRRNLPNDCRHLLRMISQAEQVDWAGYADRERYIHEGLGLDLRAVDWAVRGLEITGLAAPVPFQQAQTLGKHGGARPVRDANDQGSAGTLKTARIKRGNGLAYRQAVADRDGGSVKPRREEKSLTVLRRAWRRSTTEERAEFLREITAGEAAA